MALCKFRLGYLCDVKFNYIWMRQAVEFLLQQTLLVHGTLLNCSTRLDLPIVYIQLVKFYY